MRRTLALIVCALFAAPLAARADGSRLATLAVTRPVHTYSIVPIIRAGR